MTIEEMESTLESLGIKVINSSGVEVQATCPGHKDRTGREDQNPSWYINADSGAHICFSCGFKGNLNSLISYLGGTPMDEDYDVEKSASSLTKRLFNLLSPKPAPKEERVIITESMLAAFVDVPEEALVSRGLTLSAANEYEIKWDRLKNNWIIPVRDLSGVLLGWQEKGYSNRYFNNYPKGIKKGKALFGYGAYTSGTMVVLESPLDVVRLASVGISGGVATYGCAVAAEQFNAIRGAERIVFALDNDAAGKAASKDLLQRCIDSGTECWFFDYNHTDMKDIGAMSRAEIVSGLQSAKHMITYGRKK